MNKLDEHGDTIADILFYVFATLVFVAIGAFLLLVAVASIVATFELVT